MASSTTSSLSIGFYNLMTAFIDARPSQKGHTWPERLDAVVATIQSTPDSTVTLGSNVGGGPAILGLVEVNCVMLNDLKQRLPHYSFLGVATKLDKPFEDLTTTDFIGELLVIGYRTDLGISFVSEKDKEEKELNFGTRWFSPTPEIPCSQFNEQCRNSRAVFMARFASLRGPIVAFCSHYDDISVDARTCAIEVESNFIRECTREGDIVVAMRDGNFYPDLDEEGIPIGPRHFASLLEKTNLQLGISENHIGPVGTWIGWESDAFCCPFVDGKWKSEDRIYDSILTNQTPKRSWHHPGQFNDDGLIEISKTDFSVEFRRFASDHCYVGLEL